MPDYDVLHDGDWFLCVLSGGYQVLPPSTVRLRNLCYRDELPDSVIGQSQT